MFKRFFAKKAERIAAYKIYSSLVTQARNSVFYDDYGVEDTMDGRFEMILLDLFLVDNCLEEKGEGFIRFRRFLQEAMVSDIDRSLRELGVGDMSVGKEMKKVGSAWLGRKAAYLAAISDAEADKRDLKEVVQTNIYGKDDDSKQVLAMATYIEQAVKDLGKIEITDPLNFTVSFPEIGKGEA